MVNEVNFDGLVGMTHNYAGLGHGNLASQSSQGKPSSPRKAALEGLDKMALLMSLGVPQGVLPPHERPNLSFLRRCGFSGSDSQVFESAWRSEPRLAKVALSASPMWVANAATLTRQNGQIHITPANLAAQLHRASEVDFTSRVLRRIFSDPNTFRHHEPVFAHPDLGDEGAANHMTLWGEHQRLEIFTYGFEHGGDAPKVHAPRQSRSASEAVARAHELADQDLLLLQQHPNAIDAGVFHNDVIAVSHQNFLFAHELAFASNAFEEIQRRFPSAEIQIVSQHHIPLEDAITSYVFNSQIVATSQGRVLIAPTHADETPSVKSMLDRLVAQGVFAQVIFQPLHESMGNGGGPACLRLRVPLHPDELGLIHPGVLLNEDTIQRLRGWVETHYPDRLTLSDLQDPALIDQNRTALDELTQILGLGAFYDFQQG